MQIEWKIGCSQFCVFAIAFRRIESPLADQLALHEYGSVAGIELMMEGVQQ